MKLSIYFRTCLIFFITINLFTLNAFAQFSGSTTSSELGFTISGYQYKEKDVFQKGILYENFCTLRSVNIGLDYLGTSLFDNNWFLQGNIIMAGGSAQYSSDGSGHWSNRPHWYIDLRPLFGRNFVFENSTLAPYLGLSYRYLYNDLGYTRQSNYFYVPVGITSKINLTDQSKLITTMEFDYLFLGKQISGGVTNTQKSGYGTRASIMYQLNSWSVGPYFVYWNIRDSDWVFKGINEKGKLEFISEPHNYTIEGGIKVSYHF